jgi:hypothetical protein
MILSAGILLVLGLLDFVYTFWSPKLTPRDPAFLAMVHSQLLFQSPFLLVVGLAMVGGFWRSRRFIGSVFPSLALAFR